MFFLLASGYMPAQGGKLLMIDDVINLHWQAIEKDGIHRYYLDLRSEDIYDCANYRIECDFDFSPGEDKVEIRVRGIALNGPCLPGLGPAAALIDLTPVPGGTYKLKLVYKQYDPFIGELKISGTDLNITMEKAGIFVLGNPQLRKIPADLVWGRIEYKERPLKVEADHFLSDLTNEGAQVNNLRPGDYGLFYLREKGIQTELPAENGGYVLPFAYHYTGDPVRIRLLIKMYADRFGDDLRISFFTADGKSYLSWNL